MSNDRQGAPPLTHLTLSRPRPNRTYKPSVPRMIDTSCDDTDLPDSPTREEQEEEEWVSQILAVMDCKIVDGVDAKTDGSMGEDGETQGRTEDAEDGVSTTGNETEDEEDDEEDGADDVFTRGNEIEDEEDGEQRFEWTPNILEIKKYLEENLRQRLPTDASPTHNTSVVDGSGFSSDVSSVSLFSDDLICDIMKKYEVNEEVCSSFCQEREDRESKSSARRSSEISNAEESLTEETPERKKQFNRRKCVRVKHERNSTNTEKLKNTIVGFCKAAPARLLSEAAHLTASVQDLRGSGSKYAIQSCDTVTPDRSSIKEDTEGTGNKHQRRLARSRDSILSPFFGRTFSTKHRKKNALTNNVTKTSTKEEAQDSEVVLRTSLNENNISPKAGSKEIVTKHYRGVPPPKPARKLHKKTSVIPHSTDFKLSKEPYEDEVEQWREDSQCKEEESRVGDANQEKGTTTDKVAQEPSQSCEEDCSVESSGVEGDTTASPQQRDKQQKRRCAPSKPPRPSLLTRDLHNMEKDQESCQVHGVSLNFYCLSCREVICRDCTVVTHKQDGVSGDHTILNTPEALETLRLDALTLQRHYAVLETLHDTIEDVHAKYAAGDYVQESTLTATALSLRLKEGSLLGKIVREAERLRTEGRNLQHMQQRVRAWEEGQDSWGNLVHLAARCSLLAHVTAASDKVYLRIGDWVLPIPWIQLSHLLEPYLCDLAPSSTRLTRHSPAPTSTHLKSPKTSLGQERRDRSVSPARGRQDVSFLHNARHVMLSSLVPYIILNPDIRYFMRVIGMGEVDITLIVSPNPNHAQRYLLDRRAKSKPLLKENLQSCDDALIVLEKQMVMGGRQKSKLMASYLSQTPPSSNTPQVPLSSLVTKVSFPDVRVVAGGHGLPTTTGGVKKGDFVVDTDNAGRPILSVVMRDTDDYSARSLGYVTQGLDGLHCLVGAEDTRRIEQSGIRAKLLASMRREEEVVYEVTFGMDL